MDKCCRNEQNGQMRASRGKVSLLDSEQCRLWIWAMDSNSGYFRLWRLGLSGPIPVHFCYFVRLWSTPPITLKSLILEDKFQVHFTCCVTQGKLSNLSVPPFPLLYHRNNNIIYLTVMLEDEINNYMSSSESWTPNQYLKHEWSYGIVVFSSRFPQITSKGTRKLPHPTSIVW